MDFLPNEQIIKQSTDLEFTLTNFRVRQHYKEWDRFYTGEIFLENISSIETSYKGWTILLVIGILFVIGGIAGALSFDDATPLIFSFVGFICVAIWYSTRKVFVIITPNGGNDLRFPMSNNTNFHKELVFNVGLARINRIKQLYNSKF